MTERNPRGMKSVDRDRAEPLYHQVEVALRKRILEGEWPRGSKIPSEEQLCKTYGVSRITIRQAIRTLVEEGYLERGSGRGTFVQEPALTAGVRGLRSFSEEMRALGLTPGGKVLFIGIVGASEVVAERLGIDIGVRVIRIRRLRTGDGKPIGVQATHLPADRFPGLENKNLEDHSLYTLLSSHYGVHIAEAHETFWVAKVGRENAEALGVDRNSCAFRVERIAVDERSPIEFTASLMRGDRYRIHWILRDDDGTSSFTKE